MENAVKALEIAGGILIAILVISLFIYMFNKVSYNQAMQNSNIDTIRLEEFNKKYEAYHKNILYGADVLSVINMAKSNNAMENDSGGFDRNAPYNINVIFTIRENIVPKLVYVDRDGNEHPVMEQEAGDGTSDVILYAKDTSGTIKYDLSDRYEEKLQLLFPSETGVVVKKRSNRTYIAKSVNEEFINSIFACTSVRYNKTTGRVCEMTFEQIDPFPDD